MTHDLLALASGLAAAGIMHVAMKSTGEDWRPVDTLLGDDLTVFLVNATYGKLVPGRKTDPATSAALAMGRLRRKIPLLEQALTGRVRDHRRQLLAIPLAPLDFLDGQIEAFGAEMTRCLTEPGGSAGEEAGHHRGGPRESRQCLP